MIKVVRTISEMLEFIWRMSFSFHLVIIVITGTGGRYRRQIADWITPGDGFSCDHRND
jgi:hypothetical protein